MEIRKRKAEFVGWFASHICFINFIVVKDYYLLIAKMSFN